MDKTDNAKELHQKLKQFYKKYYLETLKLEDWENRFNNFRVNEEKNIGKKFFDRIESKTGKIENKKILIVGAGTGAEGFFLAGERNCQVSLLEPDDEALEILKLKAQNFTINNVDIFKGFAENLPFKEGQFDIVVCYTVLEHVSNYQNAIDEMYRCTKTNGTIILFLPNYAYPEEPHYKIKTFPPAFLKGMARLHLKIKKRYTPFFETLNFLTAHDVESFLNKRKIKFSKIKTLPNFSEENILIYLYSTLFKIERNQQIFIQKHE